MTGQNAIDALTLESRRFADIIRGFDGGIWWSSNNTDQIDVESLYAQAVHIRIALDEITRLAKKISS